MMLLHEPYQIFEGGTPSEPTVLMPIADGFDEWSVTYAACQFRNEGIRVVLASSQPGLVRGKYGLQIRPDQQLHHFLAFETPSLLLFAGGKATVSRLLNSAELRPCLTNSHIQIALTDYPSTLDIQPNWLFPCEQSPTHFIAKLLNHLLAKNAVC